MYKQAIKSPNDKLKTKPTDGQHKKHTVEAQPNPPRTKTRGQTRVYSERKKKTRVEHQDTASMFPPIRVFHRRFTSSVPQQTSETYRDQNHHQRKHQFQIIPLHFCVPSVVEHQSPIEISSKLFATNPKRRRFTQIRNTNQRRASNRPATRSLPLHRTTTSIKQNHQRSKTKVGGARLRTSAPQSH